MTVHSVRELQLTIFDNLCHVNIGASSIYHFYALLRIILERCEFHMAAFAPPHRKVNEILISALLLRQNAFLFPTAVSTATLDRARHLRHLGVCPNANDCVKIVKASNPHEVLNNTKQFVKS